MAARPHGRGCWSTLTCCIQRKRRERRRSPGRPPPPPAGTQCWGPRAPRTGRASPACADVAAGLWAAVAAEPNTATWCAGRWDAVASAAPTCTSPHLADKAAGPLVPPQAPPLNPAWRDWPISARRLGRPAHTRCFIQLQGALELGACQSRRI